MTALKLELNPYKVYDKYGFLVLTPEQIADRRYRLRALSAFGKGNNCKGLCEALPRAKASRHLGIGNDVGIYFCCRCEILMTVARCRCCGTIGRTKAKGRKAAERNRRKYGVY